MVHAAPHGPLLQAAGLSAAETPTAAPGFELVDHQGQTIRLQNHRGKVIFVNFWATWCPPCIYEMPLMDQLYQSRQLQPFTLWAVNMQESREDVTQFMKKKGFHFPALLDQDGVATAAYKVRGLPASYLIDCAGNLIGHVVGIFQWTNDATKTLVGYLTTGRCLPIDAVMTRDAPRSNRRLRPIRLPAHSPGDSQSCAAYPRVGQVGATRY